MNILTEILAAPFMVRALLSGILLAPVMAALGIFATLRKMSFFGDGIAHASLAGIAIAIVAGFSPLPVALAWSLLVALLVFRLERTTKLPSDTLIGILFTASLSIGVIIMSFTHGYQPELVTYMFGSILAIKNSDLTIIAVAAVILLAWIKSSSRQLTYMSLSQESAEVSGVRTERLTAMLYIALAVAIVLGVKILGIILVSALLILPPATARLLTRTFKGYAMLSIALSELTMLTGLVFSYIFDLPSGATIVLSGAALFFLAAITRSRA